MRRYLALIPQDSSISILRMHQIQKTIREEFSGAQVITIAHRLDTILDYDRVLVLDAGQIVEFAEPRALLQKGGVFKQLCHKNPDWPVLARKLEMDHRHDLQ